MEQETKIENILKRAHHVLAPGEGFSVTKDVLVITKTGPKLPLITVVDLPGLFTNTTGVQRQKAMEDIDALVDEYLRNPHSLILVVVGGNTDIVSAQGPRRLRDLYPEHDPRVKMVYDRTIGVLTKPDLTKGVGLQDSFISLVLNQEPNHKYKQWFVLRNPGPDHLIHWSPKERQRNEDQFFSDPAWQKVPKSSRGFRALKRALSVELARHIAQYVPKLQRQLKEKYADCVADIESLGGEMRGLSEMKERLLQLATISNQLVFNAVSGLYENPRGRVYRPFFSRKPSPDRTPVTHLRTRTVWLNKEFAARVRSAGHPAEIDLPSTDPAQNQVASDHAGSNQANTNQEEPNQVEPNQAESSQGESSQTESTRVESQAESSRSNSDPEQPFKGKADYAKTVILKYMTQTRGTEQFHLFNPKLIYSTFEHFSENWIPLAEMHMDTVNQFCREFLESLVAHVWPKYMQSGIHEVFIDPYMMELQSKAQWEIDQIGNDHKFQVQAYDPEFETLLGTERGLWPEGKGKSQEEVVLDNMLVFYQVGELLKLKDCKVTLLTTPATESDVHP